MSSATSQSSENEKLVVSPPVFTKEDLFHQDFQPKLLQRIAQEAILLSAGPLAIMLQVAMPGVGAGVNEHSNFAYRIQDRLRTTMTYGWCPFLSIYTCKLIADQYVAWPSGPLRRSKPSST